MSQLCSKDFVWQVGSAGKASCTVSSATPALSFLIPVITLHSPLLLLRLTLQLQVTLSISLQIFF